MKLLKLLKNFKYIKVAFKAAKSDTILNIVSVIITAGVPTLMLFATARFVDTAVEIRSVGITPVVVCVMLIFLVMLADSGVSLFSALISKRFQRKEEAYIEDQILQKCSRMQYRHIEKEEDQKLIVRVCRNASKHFTEGYNRILQMAQLIIRIVALIAVIQAYLWWAAFVVIIVALPLLYMALRNGEEYYDAFEEAEEYRRYADYYAGVISKRETCKERLLFSWFSKIEEKWEEKYEKSRKTEFHAQARVFLRTTGAGIAAAAMSLAVAAVLAPAVIKNMITPGIYISLVISSVSLAKQLTWDLTVLIQDLTKDRLYLEDYEHFSALSEISGAEEADSNRVSNVIDVRRIEFQDVTFAYPSSARNVLNHLSFVMEKGKQYALVGENAAGKSTIVKLLIGLYDNYTGRILIDGRELSELSANEKQGMLSVVFQDFAEYQMSAGENIEVGRVGDRNAAAKAAGLTDLIEGLPEGFSTRLGKFDGKDIWLSTGEWQKIALARGFYKEAPVVILDEPTAAVDPIQEADLFRLFQNRISGKEQIGILITHRLGGAMRADQILTLKDGEIIEQGTHEELIGQGGTYFKMFERQRAWYEK